MFPALAGDAQPLDFHGAPVGDDVILEGVPILLAVVAVLIGAEDLGTLDEALYLVYDGL